MGGRRPRTMCRLLAIGRTAARPTGTTTDAGMVTSEYAVGLVAAVGFAGVLYKVVTSSAMRATLAGMVERALDVPF